MSSMTSLTDDIMYGANLQDIYGMHIIPVGCILPTLLAAIRCQFRWVSVQDRGSLSGGGLSKKGSLSRGERDTSTVNRQTGAKTLPSKNFICGW